MISIFTEEGKLYVRGDREDSNYKEPPANPTPRNGYTPANPTPKNGYTPANPTPRNGYIPVLRILS